MSISNPAITIGVSAVDTAKDVLAQTDANVKRTTDSIEQSGNKLTTKFTEVSARFKQNMSSILQTAAGLGAGIAGFATSFDTLERAQVAADRANLTYSKSLERLNEMQASGKASAEELANQQEQVRIASEKARLAQDALGDTYTNFLANVPGQLISFGVAANGIYTMLRGHQVAGSVSATAHAATYSGALASMNVSNLRTIASTIALRAATIAAFLTNPATAAILGVATLITLVAFNVGGLRDAFYNLGKAVYEFFVQYFKPLADGMKWFYDNVLKPIGDFMSGEGVQSAEAYSESLSDVSDMTYQTADASAEYMNYLARLEAMTKDIDETTDAYGGTLAQQGVQYQENIGYVKTLTDATKELSSTQREANAFSDRGTSVSYQKGEFRATGELADARDKYAGIEGGLIKIGSNWLPKNLTVAKRALSSAQDMLSRYSRRIGTPDTRSEVERMAELRTRVDEARAAYEQEKINVQVTVNQNGAKTESVDVQITDARNRVLRASRQTLAGAG
jgi:hypothetical protein